MSETSPIHFTTFSQRGRGKAHNEDALLLGGKVMQGSVRKGGILEAAEPMLFAVADGVAVSHRPRTASRLLLDMLAARFAQSIQTPLNAIFHALQADYVALSEVPRYFDMAATLIGARVEGRDVSVCNAGDARAYVLDPEGGIRQLSRDHTLLQDMLAAGEITASEARHAASIYAGLTCQFIANPTFEGFDVHLARHTLRPGERLVLASDGLTEALTDKDIARLLGEGTSHALRETFRMARQQGGTDDFSVIVIEVE